MSRKRFTSEQVIGILQEAEVELYRSKNLGQICRDLGISEQTYHRWRKEHGGMKVTQARRLKDMESGGAEGFPEATEVGTSVVQ